MSKYASIDIAAMTKLVAAIDSASEPLLFAPSSYQQVMSPVHVDSSPANKLSQVSFWIADAEPGLKRRLALAQAIEAQGKSFQGVIKIDESKLSTVDPMTAQNNGATAAKQLKDAHGKVSDKLRAEIAKNANDPYFAAGFGKNLTPAQLSQIVQDASNALRTGDGGGPGSSAYKNYKALLVGMGNTMGTATRNRNDLALPPDTAKAWSNLITAQPGPDDNYTPNQAAALSVLLRHGDYDTSFLKTVSTNVYNYERSQGGKPVWGPRANTTAPIFNPDATSTDNDLATDAMANCLAGLGHNPAAAQQYFDVGNPNAKTTTIKIDGHDVKVNDRMKYLIQDRTWAPDRGSDNGAGLGSALDAASTFYRNDQRSGQISATIASQAMALVGSHVGAGHHGGHIYELGLGGSDGWQLPDDMRRSMADIVSSYAGDLMRTSGTDLSSSDDLTKGWTQPSSLALPPNGPIGASMNNDLMSALLGQIGKDPKALDTVTTGVGVTGKLAMAYQIHAAMYGDPSRGIKPNKHLAEQLLHGEQVQGVSNAANSFAGTMGYVINAGYQGDKHAQDFAQKQAQALSHAMGIVLAAPSFAVPESAPWTGYLVDQVKDAALDKVGEGPDADAKSTYNDKASNTQQNAQMLMLGTLLQGGVLTPSELNKAHPGLVGHDKNGNPQFNYGTPAFNDYLETDAPVGFLNTYVTGPFRSRFHALGD